MRELYRRAEDLVATPQAQLTSAAMTRMVYQMLANGYWTQVAYAWQRQQEFWWDQGCPDNNNHGPGLEQDWLPS